MTKQKTAPESEAASAVLAEGPSQRASGDWHITGSVNHDPAEGEQVGVGNSSGKSDKERSAAMTPQPDIFTATIPSIGAYRTQDHRYYWNGKGPYPSVTTILQVLDKPAVVQWAKRTVAEGAVNRWEELGAMLNGSAQYTELVGEPNSKERKDQTVRWLASMPDYVKDEAGKLGTGIHLLADMQARGESGFQTSDQEAPYVVAFENFLRWLRSQGAEIVSSEKMVWSVNGYAGTYDLIVRMPLPTAPSINPSLDTALNLLELPQSELWLLDIKTSKGYYPEYALQLIAYGYADQIIVADNPDGYPMPHIHRYGVLHLRPELYPDTGYRLVEYPLVEKDYIAFLAALELYQWKQEGRYTKSRLQKQKP